MLGGWQLADRWPHGPSDTYGFGVHSLHFYKLWPLRIVFFRRESSEQRAARASFKKLLSIVRNLRFVKLSIG